jgi:broad specificity phosphatase PhoE
MTIIFIRHGQTTGDVEDRYGGCYDDLLSEEGHLQASKLVSELEQFAINQLFSSNLQRAQQTANYIAQTNNIQMTSLANLRERNQYGFLSGVNKQEALKQYPDIVDKFKDRLFTLDDAESYADFSHRISEAFRHITNNLSAGYAAVVWHGGCMRVLFRDILQLGELKDIGDCAWVELANVNAQWLVKQTSGLTF